MDLHPVGMGLSDEDAIALCHKVIDLGGDVYRYGARIWSGACSTGAGDGRAAR